MECGRDTLRSSRVKLISRKTCFPPPVRRETSTPSGTVIDVRVVLHSGAWSENEATAIVRIFEQVIGKILRQDVQIRRDYEFVTVQGSVGADHIDGVGQLAQSSIVALEQFDLIVLPSMFLEV